MTKTPLTEMGLLNAIRDIVEDARTDHGYHNTWGDYRYEESSSSVANRIFNLVRAYYNEEEEYNE